MPHPPNHPRGSRPGRPDADRRLRQADRLARVLRVLQLLQTGGRYDAKAIAQELEVAERTVYRDLAVLELAGVPWAFDKEARGYRLRRDYRFPALDLTADELFGQATATAATGAAGLDIDAGAGPTMEKIGATRPASATGNGSSISCVDFVQKSMQVLDSRLGRTD